MTDGYTLEPADAEPTQQGFTLEPATEQPDTRGRLGPAIAAIPPTQEPDRPSPAEVRQRGYDDFHFVDNTVNAFSNGVQGVKDAISAARDPNRSWSERLIAGGLEAPGQAALGALGTATGPTIQALSGAVEKLSGGYVTNQDVQTALMIGGILAGAKPRLSEPLPGTVPSPIEPPKGSPAAPQARSEAARTGTPEVDSVLHNPITQAVIDNAVIDRSHTVPYMAGGSEPLADPTVYIDKHVPKEQTAPSASGGPPITFDPAEPWAVHENVEQHTMQLLIKGGMTDAEAYRVAHFEFAEPAEQAWYRAHDIDQIAAEKEQATWLPRIQHEDATDIPENFYKKPYPHANVKGAQQESVEEARPSPEEVARAMDIIRNAKELQPRDPLDGARQAQQMGIAGPERPEPTFDASSTVLAEQALPRDLNSAVTPEELTKIRGHEPGEYDVRGKEWIDKIDAPDDAREAIEKIAAENDFFPEARGGQASVAARNAVAEAAGVDSGELDAEYFSTHFDSDGKVRAVIQALRQTVKDYTEAAARAAKEPTPENLATAEEARLRHTHVLEYTMGLRAESGRTLAAWKDLLRATEETRAKVALRDKETTGAAPKGVADLVDAMGEVRENLKAGKPPGLMGLVNAAQNLVDNIGKPTEDGKPPAAMTPEIRSLVEEARKTLKAFGGDQGKTTLERLIKQAEQQAIDMTKQRPGRPPTEALPPELQGLVDKTQRIVKSFGGIARGEQAAMLLGRTGRTVTEQEQLVRSVNGLTPNQVAKVLNKLRTSPEANKPGWFYWLWQQGLISGLVTHTGYALTNMATVFSERVLSPFLGAALDRMRGGNASIAGPLYANVAMVRSVPDALSAAGQAFKTNMRVPLESEMRLFARGEESPQSKGASNAFNQPQGPDWGIWKNVFNETQLDKAASALGIPGKAANMMHTFFKVLSERASASTRAFEEAHQESVTGDKFWERYQFHLDNPTDDALRGAVNDAYTGAFMAKLSPNLGAFAHTLKSNPIAKWIFPFQHIPWNIARMSIEYSPFAALGPEMRGALLGKKGAPAQNLAIAKMAIGSSALGYFMHKALSGEATSDYPTDPQERRRWEMLGIQPNSIQIGGEWVSFERLGPAGNVAHMGTSIGSIIHNYNGQSDDALTSALWAAANATANQIGNEVGFQSLKNIIDALENPQQGKRFMAWQIGSFAIPFSSFVSQNASVIDPDMRRANDLISGLKYRIPFLREQLLPKRDPLFGEPVHNPGYGTIRRSSPVNDDPVKAEMDAIHYYPVQPRQTIGKIKLTPERYDEYQAMAGAMVKEVLGEYVRTPGWDDIPAVQRLNMVRESVKAARQSAGQIVVRRQLDEAQQ